MHIMPVDDTSSSLSSSISETSSILSSISSCCSHNAIDFDNSNVDNISSGGNLRTSLQFILNQNQNNNSLDYWEFNNNEEEDLNQEYNNHDDCYYYYTNSHLNTSHHHQFNTEYQYQYQYQYNSSNGKLNPPPSPPPMEMDLLETDQILLTSDEFNSIFDSFTAVADGRNLNHNHNHNLFIEDGCMRGTNCNNGLLDDEQLSKALGAIAMI